MSCLSVMVCFAGCYLLYHEIVCDGGGFLYYDDVHRMYNDQCLNTNVLNLYLRTTNPICSSEDQAEDRILLLVSLE